MQIKSNQLIIQLIIINQAIKRPNYNDESINNDYENDNDNDNARGKTII